MDSLYPLLERLTPLLGGGVVLVAALRIVYRYMELRFTERESLRKAAETEEGKAREHFQTQFNALVTGAAGQVQTLEQLVEFIRKQWEQDTRFKTDLILKLEQALRRQRVVMESCERCAAILDDPLTTESLLADTKTAVMGRAGPAATAYEQPLD